ncbi:MAG: 3-hydroxyacid dehydrogenase protein [Polaromonas sp.]|jgi:3-hydroxyisobutyrate dehydrogenase|nr:3-hydroxyacid dehydrogenase protein [Polaromonas sp.]
MKISFIGLGEVGRCFAKVFAQAGFEVHACEPFLSAAAANLVKECCITLHARMEDCVNSADWVLLCTTGEEALALCEAVAPLLKAGACVADLTTASPDDKRQAHRLARSSGTDYLDVAIMGGVSLTLEKTPLLVAGNRGNDFLRLTAPMGCKVTALASEPGDAIALKLLRSVFTKGVEGLCVEMLVAADRQGVRTQLYDVLSDIDRSSLQDFMEMIVRTHVIHAARRAHEVHHASDQLRQMGLPSEILNGVERRFRVTAEGLQKTPLATPNPTIEQALQWLDAQSLQTPLTLQDVS